MEERNYILKKFQERIEENDFHNYSFFFIDGVNNYYKLDLRLNYSENSRFWWGDFSLTLRTFNDSGIGEATLLVLSNGDGTYEKNSYSLIDENEISKMTQLIKIVYDIDIFNLIGEHIRKNTIRNIRFKPKFKEGDIVYTYSNDKKELLEGVVNRIYVLDNGDFKMSSEDLYFERKGQEIHYQLSSNVYSAYPESIVGKTKEEAIYLYINYLFEEYETFRNLVRLGKGKQQLAEEFLKEMKEKYEVEYWEYCFKTNGKLYQKTIDDLETSLLEFSEVKAREFIKDISDSINAKEKVDVISEYSEYYNKKMEEKKKEMKTFS